MYLVRSRRSPSHWPGEKSGSPPILRSYDSMRCCTQGAAEESYGRRRHLMRCCTQGAAGESYGRRRHHAVLHTRGSRREAPAHGGSVSTGR
eukprot:9474343-Pyramimonas_sp.AAC.1